MLSNNLTYFNYEKKFFFIAVSAIVAVSAGIFAYLNSESKSDDMFSANVEALADNEYEYSDGYPFTTICGVAISNSRRCKVTVITCQGGGSGCNSRPCPVHG